MKLPLQGNLNMEEEGREAAQGHPRLQNKTLAQKTAHPTNESSKAAATTVHQGEHYPLGFAHRTGKGPKFSQ